MLMNALWYASTQVVAAYPHVLEFGVYTGGTLTQLRDLLGRSHNIFGFDSFEGLPEAWRGTEIPKGFFTLNGEVPNIPGTRIFKGWFEDTVKEYLAAASPIALLHLDCDLYSSTKTVLDGIGHLLLPGSIICCDEWLYRDTELLPRFDQEQQAVLDWIETQNKRVHFCDFADMTSMGHERRVLKIL